MRTTIALIFMILLIATATVVADGRVTVSQPIAPRAQSEAVQTIPTQIWVWPADVVSQNKEAWLNDHDFICYSYGGPRHSESVDIVQHGDLWKKMFVDEKNIFRVRRCGNKADMFVVSVTEQIPRGEIRYYTTRPTVCPPPEKVVVPPAPSVNNNYNYNTTYVTNVSYNCTPQNWQSYPLNASYGAMVQGGAGLSVSFVPRTNIDICVSSSSVNTNNIENNNANTNVNTNVNGTVVNVGPGSATGTATGNSSGASGAGNK